jgi:hypothetical protein
VFDGVVTASSVALTVVGAFGTSLTANGGYSVLTRAKGKAAQADAAQTDAAQAKG